MFCSLDIHRRNINRAISANMLAEIGMDNLVVFSCQPQP